MASELFPRLADYVSGLLTAANLIDPDRKERLRRLRRFVHEKSDTTAALNFICTHNSRRSHLGQIWASVAAHYYDLPHVQTFSGGTEATAFNPRAVAALQRAGFAIDDPGGDNPRYVVRFSPDAPPLTCWSKVFDDPANPAKDFAAIMTCSHADENCPFIPGAQLRLPLTYDDPKEADGTPQEADRYDERVRQIGRELFFAFGED
ncbi:protein-tyrosine-phosphatase [Lewinella sp. JB7]|uniref:protein-tyrosine-phosphatase n=1 Tax=Lewinella sp. JB7 TaxID=2962887 RepID=UPI0020C9D286|nr:protein-tyrosine-phosphatase [Lewinella sp. JB7]MCP9234848.1 protein-tyrosine-phosphatase [Lewinella sp. JB7]